MKNTTLFAVVETWSTPSLFDALISHNSYLPFFSLSLSSLCMAGMAANSNDIRKQRVFISTPREKKVGSAS
jgi:hypothetical protein